MLKNPMQHFGHMCVIIIPLEKKIHSFRQVLKGEK